MANYELNKDLYISDNNMKLDDINTKFDNIDTSISNITTLLQKFYPFEKKYYGTSGTTVNANDFKSSGVYLFDTYITVTNRPTKVAQALEYLIVLETAYSSCTIQIWFNGSSALYFRLRNWSTWASWKKITIS